jgi:hypothetical protein
MSVCYHKPPVCQHETRTKLGEVSVGGMILLNRRAFVFRGSVSGFLDSRASISCQQELLYVVIVVFVVFVRVVVVVLMV